MKMDMEKKLKMVQTFYAGALADSVLRLGREGILEKVTDEKRNEQLQSGKIRAQQLGIQTAPEVFEVLSDIFGCANWMVEKNANGFSAEATSCILCAMAKKLGAQCPCNIYCLDAMEGLVKGISSDADYKVESTLWNSNKCKVVIKENNKI